MLYTKPPVNAAHYAMLAYYTITLYHILSLVYHIKGSPFNAVIYCNASWEPCWELGFLTPLAVPVPVPHRRLDATAPANVEFRVCKHPLPNKVTPIPCQYILIP